MRPGRGEHVVEEVAAVPREKRDVGKLALLRRAVRIERAARGADLPHDVRLAPFDGGEVTHAIGGFLGLGLAWLIASRGSPIPEYLPIFNFDGRDLVTGIILVFALGISAGAFPAWQAMQLKIAIALRRNA